MQDFNRTTISPYRRVFVLLTFVAQTQGAAAAAHSNCRFEESQLQAFSTAYFGYQEVLVNTDEEASKKWFVYIWYPHGAEVETEYRLFDIDANGSAFVAVDSWFQKSSYDILAYAIAWQDKTFQSESRETQDVTRISAGLKDGPAYEMIVYDFANQEIVALEIGCSVNLLDVRLSHAQ